MLLKNSWYNMSYWIRALGVLLITFEQIVDGRSFNMCIQSVNLAKDSVGTTIMYINVIKFGIYSIKLYGKRNTILSAYHITLY